MSIFLDIIGSWVIRAALIAVMLKLTINLNNVLYQRTQQANANGLVAVVDSVIYADVNAAGYSRQGVTFDRTTTFYAVTWQSLSFYADISSSSGVELVKYYTTYSSGTKLYTLYRQVNSGTPMVLGNSLSQVAFKYYNASGVEDSTLINIRQVRVIVAARYVLTNANVNTKGTSSDTSFVYSDFRVVPPNLL